VEPKYEKKLETLEEILNADVVYGYHPVLYLLQESLSYPEFVKFQENKKVREECNDIRKCAERMITKRDMAAVVAPMFATFVAKEMGTVDVDKVICSLDDLALSGSLILLFKKGNPLLDRFNILMRRYLEAGLQESLWTELQHRASLSGAERYRGAVDDRFFAFSVSHLMPAFVVLLLGTVLSSVVFVFEVIVNCLCRRRRNVIRAFGD
jgi:hypothetical protein